MISHIYHLQILYLINHLNTKYLHIFCNLHKIHSPQFYTPLGYNWGWDIYPRLCKPSKNTKKPPISYEISG